MALYVFGSAILVMAVAIILCVCFQQGKSQGLGAMAGGSDAADSYFSKNKNRSRDVILNKVTIVLAVLIGVCVIAMNVVGQVIG